MLRGIALNIPLNFVSPVVSIGSRNSGSVACVVTVPKATVHKQDLFPAREDKIGLARQVFAMQAITIAHPVDDPTNRHFGASILRPHPPHDSGTARRCDGVHYPIVLPIIL